MRPGNNKKLIVISPRAIVDNASWTTGEIDTLGFNHCQIDVFLGALDIAMVALKVQESDVAGSGQVDVPGLIFGTSNGLDGTASVLPSATNDDKIFSFDVDMRGRKRYLTLVATGGDGSAGSYAAAIATLSEPETSRDTAAQRGAINVLRV